MGDVREYWGLRFQYSMIDALETPKIPQVLGPPSNWLTLLKLVLMRPLKRPLKALQRLATCR